MASRIVTPFKLYFSKNGSFVGILVVDEANSESLYIEADAIVTVADRDGMEKFPVDLLASFDLPAEETDDGSAVDGERRREFLRARGKEIWRTLGRQLGHIPSDAFRIVYSYGINQRRVKDVWFVSYLPGRDVVVIRDITNRRKQSLPTGMVLSVTDPRTGRALTGEDEIRAFLQRFRPRTILSMVFGRRKAPEIA